MTRSMSSDTKHVSTRRELLQVGSIGLLGLGMSDVAAMRGHAGEGAATDSRSVIFVFLSGGAPQHDTFDMKPDGPSEFRGEFSPIQTSTPGVEICEHLPLLAKQSQHWNLVRSLGHTNNAHEAGSYIMTTGRQDLTPFRANNPNANDWPSIAAVAGAMSERRGKLAPSVILPEKITREDKGDYAGQLAGRLGRHNNPWLLEMTDKPHGDHAYSGAFPGHLYNLFKAKPSTRDDWRFELPHLALPEDVFSRRLRQRVDLLEVIERQRRKFGQASAVADFDRARQGAVSLLTAPKVREAFDVRRAPQKTLERYGDNSFGWSLLMARRLVRLGVNLIQVHLGNQGTWDLHGNAFPIAKNFLFPPTDRAIAGLLEDLAESGELEQTMVVVAGEFGRTPKIFTANGYKTPGRNHWAPCQSVLIAGGGAAGGRVIGSTDRNGAYPTSDPQTPENFAATIYHSLRIPRDAHWCDVDDRPYPVYNAEPIRDLFT